jgi:hypothetical protein
MIVWGGVQSPQSYLNTGGRYDPVTDTWTPTSLTGAPTGRYIHTAVWTGSKMIVWGGTGFSPTNTGSRYDPATDSWAATWFVTAPTARSLHSAVWTGSRMIVWGGGSESSGLNTGGRYDPVADAWLATSTVNAPLGRVYQVSAWTGSFLITWGGYNDVPLSTGGRYALGQSIDDDGDGYSECGGDCNDANASVQPGAAEVCNGIDDNCDLAVDNGIAPPAGTPALTGVAKSGTDVELSWSPMADATGYDVVKGDITTLLSSGGDFTAATTACLADDLGVTTAQDTEVPAPGSGLWYLTRAMNACGGNGTYDEGSASQQGSRDAEIDASSAACP